MKEHECIIGVLLDYENTDLITFRELKQRAEQRSEIFKNGGYVCSVAGVYDLDDYLDKRKNTNIVRFNYCPICGEKIDWKGLKSGR